MTVKLNLRGRDLTSFLNEAQNTINEKVHYDKNKYTIKWGGAFENQKRAYTRLAVIIPLTLTGMFILLYVTFGKFRQAGLVLAIVPLALFGGMLALNVRGMTLNVSSAVGFIAMFGLSIQNGIIMVSQVNGLAQGRNGTPEIGHRRGTPAFPTYSDDFGHYDTRTFPGFVGNRNW